MESANAAPGTPLWACSMKAKLQNDSGAFIIGVVDKHGPAIVKCTSLETLMQNKTITRDAYVTIHGAAIGIDLNFVDQQVVYMGTGRVGLRSIDHFYGRHQLSLNANANLLVLEVGASVGVEFGNRVADINSSAQISGTQGLGATISLESMRVYPSKDEYLKAKARREARNKR